MTFPITAGRSSGVQKRSTTRIDTGVVRTAPSPAAVSATRHPAPNTRTTEGATDTNGTNVGCQRSGASVQLHSRLDSSRESPDAASSHGHRPVP
ncbi:hypothetical protein ACFOY4_28135 [Actinomadura syzygii]|uniref:Uncharacterized protein n=1 Tax=Actinomadura syzygii TaxID=1427538 RepID=A0A5D0UK19_9ACTN|nr:hypothetical protein [Actinomadura syzygii]TYC17489.1 hypothetical protein FXF65_05635 [Actinomadura syzygii]